MNVWKGLLTREWLEHKGGFGWGPVITAIVVVSIVLISLTVSNVTFDVGDSLETDTHATTTLREMINDSLAGVEITESELETRLAMIRQAVASIFYLVFSIIVFFTLLSMLYDDRKDRSVLFWKSAPVSDSETVVAKYVAAAWVAPVATIAMIFVTQVFLFLVMSFFLAGTESISVADLWLNSGLIGGVFHMVIGFLIHGLWAAPIYGWPLFVSSAVNKAPFMWAVFPPAIVCILENILFDTTILIQGIGNHAAMRALTTSRTVEIGDDLESSGPVGVSDAFGLFATTDMWIGLVIGGALLYGAIYFRQRNNEI